MSTKHLTYAKIVRGPGGFACRCCTVFSKPLTKRLNNRALRRSNRRGMKAVSIEG